jgi:hypothetical protein
MLAWRNKVTVYLERTKMEYPDHVDIIEANGLVQDIDFLEVDIVRKIEVWNTNTFFDDELTARIATFWIAEDGISSMEAFEEVIHYYHMMIKE